MPHHHYVPRFLLREWLVEDRPGQDRVRAYYKDERTGAVKCWPAGLMQVCYGEDLFTIEGHPLADAVERRFFALVDGDGAAAHRILEDKGPQGLTLDQRINFVRLLLSLDARRPNVVRDLRVQGGKHIRDGLNSPDILAAFEAHSITGAPRQWYEHLTGVSMEDDAMLIVQKLTDNPKVGKSVLNAYWGVRHLNEGDGYFVLSDRPLVRIAAHDSPGAVWATPLTPTAAFVAAAHQSNLDRLQRLTGQRFRKEMNTSSAIQADRYVFSLGEDNLRWLERRLAKGERTDAAEITDSPRPA